MIAKITGLLKEIKTFTQAEVKTVAFIIVGGLLLYLAFSERSTVYERNDEKNTKTIERLESQLDKERLRGDKLQTIVDNVIQEKIDEGRKKDSINAFLTKIIERLSK